MISTLDVLEFLEVCSATYLTNMGANCIDINKPKAIEYIHVGRRLQPKSLVVSGYRIKSVTLLIHWGYPQQNVKIRH